jgi:predicted permease
MALLLEDLRFAVRLFRKSPGFTAVAVLTLALAIGANTAIFSVVNGVLLRPAPFHEPERLFQVMRRHPDGAEVRSLSVPQYLFLARQSEPFTRVAARWGRIGGFNLREGEQPERVPGFRVTQSFFEVLGVQPELGRGFLPEEDVPGGPRVVVLGHELWQRRFGGSPDVVGRSISLGGEPYTVVGIAPRGFRYPGVAQLWVPMQLDPASTEDTNIIHVLGRLKPGIQPEQAASLLAAQSVRLRATRAGVLSEDHQLVARALREVETRAARPALLVLLGTVGCVLLIACVNLANLLLARAAGRQRELAIRAVLGASRPRIVRQLLTESVLLAGSGGLLGLLLAAWSLPTLLALAPRDLPLPAQVGLDGNVLGVTFIVSVLTGVLFGLLPALRASRVDLQEALKVSTSHTTTGLAGNRTRWLLVVSEVALVVILLVSAALLMKNFARLIGTAPGIDSTNVLTMKLSLPEARYASPEALEALARSLIERVETVPGVLVVGFTSMLPLDGMMDLDFAIEGSAREAGGGRKAGGAQYRAVTPGYFEALKLGLVRGRLLTDRDRLGRAPVVLINQAAERRYWPTRDPIGQHITIGYRIPQLADPEPREIIGVVSDVHEQGLGAEPPAIVYVPVGQVPAPLQALIVRTLPYNLLVRASGNPASLAEAVQREIHAVDPGQPVTDILLMEEIVERSLGSQRFNTLLMGLMAGLALVLAAVGIYGVLSYLVSRRIREMGVRLALGSTRAQVVWLVMRQGLSMALVGVGLGVVGALGATRLLEHLLYSVSALDPVVFGVAPAGVLGVALLATWLPAYRASRVNPMVALRME